MPDAQRDGELKRRRSGFNLCASSQAKAHLSLGLGMLGGVIWIGTPPMKKPASSGLCRLPAFAALRSLSRPLSHKWERGGRDQNAGTTAPLYLLWMNCFTSGLFSALASFWMAGLSLLSWRATRMFT